MVGEPEPGGTGENGVPGQVRPISVETLGNGTYRCI